MLGLGNTLNKGVVSAAAASFSNTKSIDFDGGDDYMISDNNIAVTRGTFQFWMKTTTAASGTPFNFTAAHHGYLVESGGELYFWAITPMGNRLYNSGDLLTDGEWHQILWTTEGASGESSSLKIYIDGEIVATQTQTSTYSDVDAKLQLGRFNPYNWYTGNMDEVAIWNTALDADAVEAIYNNGEPVDLSDSGNYDNSGDLVHWWRMGDGDTYPTIEDNAGSNNMTMTNMASGDIELDVPAA